MLLILFSCKEKREFYTHIPKVRLQLCISSDRSIDIYDENGEFILRSSSVQFIDNDIFNIIESNPQVGDTIRVLVSYPNDVTESEKRNISLKMSNLTLKFKNIKGMSFNAFFLEDKILWVCR